MTTNKINVNIGVLGHVDSGKTTLVKALSTRLSTACLDKNPQSQERGMTLDLGFSAFDLTDDIQITLVDCPGHATLFKTILSGLQIIDMMLLVVDVQKGLQPQSIECFILAKLAKHPQIIVVLNKIDLLTNETYTKIQQDIQLFLKRLYGKDQQNLIDTIPFVPVSATNDFKSIETLRQVLRKTIQIPQRSETEGPFCFAIDHCFGIHGNGTILTGTVLSGTIQLNDEIEIPSLQIIKKIKSMQSFQENISQASQGDRVALRVHGLDPSLIERSLAITPKSMFYATQVIVPVNWIPFFQLTKCKSNCKMHVSIGNTTILAQVMFFSPVFKTLERFDFNAMYQTVPELPLNKSTTQAPPIVYALLTFGHPSAVLCKLNMTVICSRLDLDPKRFPCRLMFYGPIVHMENNKMKKNDDTQTKKIHLRMGKVKEKIGKVDKICMSTNNHHQQPHTVIVNDLVSKDADVSMYLQLKLLFVQSKCLGQIQAPFGKTGKLKVTLLSFPSTSLQIGDKVVLRFWKEAANGPIKVKGNLTQPKDYLITEWLYPEVATEIQNPLPPPSPLPLPPKTSFTLDDKTTPLYALSLQDQTTIERKIRKEGQIERLKGETSQDGHNPFAIVVGLFQNEEEAQKAIGTKVYYNGDKHSSKKMDIGEIEKTFGKTGKVRVDFLKWTNGKGTLAQIGDSVYI